MYHSGRYKCEYGPKDYSRIVKPITEELLPKPRKKLRKPDVPQEGNLVAPTRKARAKRAKAGDVRKPPRRFKSKTPATEGDATESVVENPVQSPKKRSVRKKKGCCDNGCVPVVGNEGSCEAAIPDLNELPTVCDPDVPPLKVVRKRGPRKKKCESHSPVEAVGPASVTGITGDSVIDPEVAPPKVVRKRGPRKKKCETHSPLESVGQASVTAITADVKQAKPRCTRKKKDAAAAGSDTKLSCGATDRGPGEIQSGAPINEVGDPSMEGVCGVLGGVEDSTELPPLPNPLPPLKPAITRKARKDTNKNMKAKMRAASHHSQPLLPECFLNVGSEPTSGADIGPMLSALCDTVGAPTDTENCPGEVVDPEEAPSFDLLTGKADISAGCQPRPKGVRDSKKKWGGSIKKGCLAQFTVKSLLYLPHVSEICILQEKHVNADGLVVHGGMKVGDRSAFSAHLSPEIRAFVEECLRRKDTVSQIMRKHLDMLKKYQEEGRDITRDLLLSTKDIRNISGKLAQETYMLHKNDAQSVRMWVQKNPDKVFHYTESNKHKPVPVPGELNGNNMPFTIGIQTQWQKKMMLQHGHRGGISVDATFGTNDKKVQYILSRLPL